jgi:hypothetical protein
MCCFVGGLAILGPRFVLAAWWLFGSKVDAAFDSAIWPLLGLIFLPAGSALCGLPRRTANFRIAFGQAPHSTTVNVHHVDVRGVALAVALEDDPSPVRRPHRVPCPPVPGGSQAS